MPALFALTLFISATLLFMVQPMVAKMVLPLMGGSPAVWNTCMVFFQSLLLFGYLYAHKLTDLKDQKKQISIHMGVLLLAMIAMIVSLVFSEKQSAIAILSSLAPRDTSLPFIGVIGMLLVAIGVPFFAVSTSAPLLQSWFAKTGHPSGKDPYFLYAASNAGSLISLLGYPLFLEPSLRVVHQTWLWGTGFLLLFGFILQCGRSALKPLHPPEQQPTSPTNLTTIDDTSPPSLARKLRWVALGFVPSSLMLGVTTFVTTDIASVPMLWVIPLSLYLLTFIIAFARTPRWYRPVIGNAAPVVSLLLVFVITSSVSLSTFAQLAFHIFSYFMTSLLMHSELALDRPNPKYLTGYFLLISVGGVLGGIFNAILAPLIFPLAFEYPVAIVIGCLLIPKMHQKKATELDKANKEGWQVFLDILLPIIMVVVAAGLYAVSSTSWFYGGCDSIANGLTKAASFAGLNMLLSTKTIVLFLVFAPPCMLCFIFIDRPIRFGLCVAAILFVHQYHENNDKAVIMTKRSYFGIMRITENENSISPQYYLETTLDTAMEINTRSRSLSHGTTLHGMQYIEPFLQPALRDDIRLFGVSSGWESLALLGAKHSWNPTQDPLTYYHRTGPIGAIFLESFRRTPLPKVGMVGLGTGSVAAYAIKDQEMTFFEIDPVVREMIEDENMFTFVNDAKKRGANIDVVLGDARLTLSESEKKFDLLLIDAFSSDSIPTHLLTIESVKMFMERVQSGGLLAMHISNRYLALEPIVAAICAKHGYTCRLWSDPVAEYYLQPGKTASSWVIIGRTNAELGTTFLGPDYDPNEADAPVPAEDFAWQPIPVNPQIAAWTDDYVDVLLVTRFKELQAIRRFFGLPTPLDGE